MKQSTRLQLEKLRSINIKKEITKYLFSGFLLITLLTMLLLHFFFEPTWDWESADHSRAKLYWDIFLTVAFNFLLLATSCGAFLCAFKVVRYHTAYQLLSFYTLPAILILLLLYGLGGNYNDRMPVILAGISYFSVHLPLYTIVSRSFDSLVNH